MLLPLLLLGCATPTTESWTAQLSPAGPCWEVQLGDGLSEEDTTELHNLFDCINQNENFEPLAGVVDAMDASSRDGVPLGVELARVVNLLPTLDVDVFGLAGFALDMLEKEPTLIEEVLYLAVEAIYGVPFVDIGDEPEQGQAALDQGLIRPALPLLSQTAAVILDEGLTSELGDTLDSQTLDDGICLLVGLNLSDDPAIAALSDDLLPDLGQAIALSRSPSNDVWSGASGDSLRDLVDAALLSEVNGQNVVEALRPDLLQILSDEALRDRIRGILEDAEAGGNLDPLPIQLLYLAEVDVNGGRLSSNEDTALLSLLRMLHTADEPLSCSVDILGLSLLDVNIDNLSVEILRNLATQDPNTINDALNLLGGALGWGITQSIMDLVVDSGVCPLLNDQLIDDLESVNRLSDPEAADLLIVMLDILGAFYDEDLRDDQTDALVGVLSQAYGQGAVPPLEEALRDLAASALIDDVTDLVPVLLAADELPTDSCPTGAAPLTFEATWSLLADAIEEGGSLDKLEPVARVLLENDALWVVLGNMSNLLAEDQANLQDLADIMTRVIALDPDLSVVRDNIGVFADPALVDPTLRIVESTELASALGKAELTSEGPLPFVARLIVGDTLAAVLRTVDLLMGSLTGEEN